MEEVKGKNRSEIKKENSSSSSIIICPGLGILNKPHTHTHIQYTVEQEQEAEGWACQRGGQNFLL